MHDAMMRKRVLKDKVKKIERKKIQLLVKEEEEAEALASVECAFHYTHTSS